MHGSDRIPSLSLFVLGAFASVIAAAPLVATGDPLYLFGPVLLLMMWASLWVEARYYWASLIITVSCASAATAWAGVFTLLPWAALSLSIAVSMVSRRATLSTYQSIISQGRDSALQRTYAEDFSNAVTAISAEMIHVGLGDMSQAIQDALGVIARYLGAGHCMLYQIDVDSGDAVLDQRWDRSGSERIPQLFGRTAPLKAFPWFRDELLADRIVELSTSERPGKDEPGSSSPEIEALRAAGIDRLVLVPVRIDDAPAACLAIVNPDSSPENREAGRRIARVAAESVANALYRRRAEEQAESGRRTEADLASRIQQHLLFSTIPEAPAGLSVYATTIPSEHVDGDFYEVVSRGGSVDVVVGDVMGKGVPAALVSAAIKTQFWKALLRLESNRRPGAIPRPSRVVDAVSEQMTGELLLLGSFFTLGYMRLDIDRGLCWVVDCGHPPILRYNARRGVVERLRGANTAIGMLEQEKYIDFAVPSGPGDVFLCYSDGVTEATDESGNQFGVTRLMRTLSTSRFSSARDVVEDIERAVFAFAGQARIGDDLTCAAIVVPAAEHKGSMQVLSRTHRVLGSSTADLADSRQWVEDELVAHVNLSDSDRHRMVLGVHEAVANAAMHAYAGRDDGAIEVDIRICTRSITFAVRHYGKEFDPADELVGGGLENVSRFGMLIMRNVFDSVTYTTTDDGEHCVYLVVTGQWTRGGVTP